MTRIFYTDVSVLSDDAIFRAFFEKAGAKRQTRVNSLKRQKDKAQSLGAYICYMEAMRAFGADDNTPWQYLDNGKPCFREDTGLSFSLSHSADIAIAVVSEHRVGIDVEKIEDCREGVCRRYFLHSEAEYVLGTADIEGQGDRFFRLWTLKEAYAKMTGMGVGSFSEFEVIPANPPSVKSSEQCMDAHFFEFDIDGYRCSLCTEGAEDDIKISNLKLLELLIK